MARSSIKDTLEKFRFGMAWGAIPTTTTQVAGGTPTSIINLSALGKAGFHDMQLPKRTTNKIMYREGNDPDISSISAGLSTMEDIVLSRGVLASESAFKEMYAWAQLVHSSNDTTSALGYNLNKTKLATGNEAYRKDVWIWMYTRTGTIAKAWKLFNAFPVSFVPGSDLNASEDGEKSLEQLTLTYEDFMEVLPTDLETSILTTT